MKGVFREPAVVPPNLVNPVSPYTKYKQCEACEMLVETETHYLEDSQILSHSTGLHLQRTKGLALHSAFYFHCPVQSSG